MNELDERNAACPANEPDFEEIETSLAGFALADEGLGNAQRFGQLYLREASFKAGFAEKGQEQLAAMLARSEEFRSISQKRI